MAMIFTCPKCGYDKMQEGEIVCPLCGFEINKKSDVNTDPNANRTVLDDHSAQETQSIEESQHNDLPRPSVPHKTNTVLRILLMLGSLLVIVVIIWRVFPRGCQKTPVIPTSVAATHSTEQSTETESETETDQAPEVSLIPLNGSPGFIDEGFENLFDGNPDTKWCIPFHGSASVTWKMSEPVIVDCLSVTSANDNSKFPGRNPAAFTFLGSENDETYENDNWTVLYYRNPTELMSHDEEDFFLEEIEMPKKLPAFQYYKVEFTATTGTDILQLSEIVVNYNLG